MFRLDITLEDCRIIADRTADNGGWNATLADNLTGRQFPLVLDDNQLSILVAIAIDGDGYEDQYAVIEPLLVDCPPECRPIP